MRFKADTCPAGPDAAAIHLLRTMIAADDGGKPEEELGGGWELALGS